MEQTHDVEMILNSLNKDKRELLDKVGEIDKLIKRIKYGNLNLGLNKVARIDNPVTDIEVIEQPQAFPLKADPNHVVAFWQSPGKQEYLSWNAAILVCTSSICLIWDRTVATRIKSAPTKTPPTIRPMITSTMAISTSVKPAPSLGLNGCSGGGGIASG